MKRGSHGSDRRESPEKHDSVLAGVGPLGPGGERCRVPKRTATSRQWSLALGMSVLIHMVVTALGLGLTSHRFAGPIDIEIAGTRTVEAKDLPLGAPVAGHTAASRAPNHPHRRAQPPAVGGLSPKADDRHRVEAQQLMDEHESPKPIRDLAAYGPRGARLTVLLRLDRLRGTDYATAVNGLLETLPDGRDLLQGTGPDLLDALDALLFATARPLDPSATFLAVRHRLDYSRLRAALDRGANATNRMIIWGSRAGRPVGERRVRLPLPGTAPTHHDRLIVLAAPGLLVVTPPAYCGLLLTPPRSAFPSDSGVPSDAGVGSGFSRTPDGGAMDWATVLGRIDAEEGLIPSEGVLMVSAVDIFKNEKDTAGASPLLHGMEVPAVVRAIVGIDSDDTTLDVEGEFPTDKPVRHWETEWPTIERQLVSTSLAMVTEFSSVMSRAKLTCYGNTVRVHLSATHAETLSLLRIALHLVGD